MMKNTSESSSCPSCGEDNVMLRRGVGSVVAFAVLLILTWMISNAFPLGSGLSSGGFMLAVMSVVLKWVFLFATILSIVSALGSNRCKECGHKWR